MLEIGSEFWETKIQNTKNNLDILNIGKDYELLMSGRTAIDFCLQDFNDRVKVVYMPNYCCNSILQSFIDNGCNIIYYYFDFINKKYIIDTNTRCSVFFAISYFGYSDSTMDDSISQFSINQVIVIEDITHRFLSNKNHCENSTYLVASLRKWIPILPGGIAIKTTSKFSRICVLEEVSGDFVKYKKQAMCLKRRYLQGEIDSKEDFLEYFKKSNEYFFDYRNKAIDYDSRRIVGEIDFNLIKKQRVLNSIVIGNKLRNNLKTKLLFNYKDGDCPLFVPILIEGRDIIRKKMADRSVYLPMHWPNSLAENKIVEQELSLINDQRYNESIVSDYIDILIEVIGN